MLAQDVCYLLVILLLPVTAHMNVTQPLDSILLKQLLTNYDKRAVPRNTDAIVVKVGYTLVQLHSLDEKNQLLTTSGWFQIEWVDYRLAWNTSEYNRSNVVIPSSDLWLPDIGFLNSVSSYTVTKNEFRCVVYSDGSVLWVPGGTFSTTCELDISLFPFDNQKCQLHLTNWAYNLAEMDLVAPTDHLTMDSYRISAEWDVTKTSITREELVYECCGDIPYPSLFFLIDIQRKSLYYLVNIVTPCIILSFLATFTFCVPPESGEKISLGITLLLSFTVFQLIVAESIPRRSDSVPIISLYIASITGTVTASIVTTILITRIYHMGTIPIPYGLRRITFDYLARLFCLSHLAEKHGTSKCCKKRMNKRLDAGKQGKSLLQNTRKLSETTLASENSPLKTAENSVTFKLIQITNGHLENIIEFINDYDQRRQIEEESSKMRAEWKALGRVYDRFFFVLFIFITVAITTAFLVPSHKTA